MARLQQGRGKDESKLRENLSDDAEPIDATTNESIDIEIFLNNLQSSLSDSKIIYTFAAQKT